MRGNLGPLAGIGFIVLVIIGFAISGEPPDAESAPDEIVNHYLDNKDAIEAGSFIGVAALILFLFFANHLRRLFAAAGEAPLSATILVGAAILAVGVAIDGTIQIALAEAADDIEATSVQTLQALWDNDFLPMALGTLLFAISAGVSTLQTGALPKWLGWAALVLAVIGFTPAGFVAFLGMGVWILVTAGLLMARGSGTGTPAASGPA